MSGWEWLGWDGYVMYVIFSKQAFFLVSGVLQQEHMFLAEADLASRPRPY